MRYNCTGQLNNKMKKIFNLLFLVFLGINLVSAADAYKIDVKVNGFSEKEAYLGYHFGDKQYIKDTVSVSPDGSFVFKGEEALKGGVYLVILPPDNQYFQILIDKDEQFFQVETTVGNMNADVKIKGSDENQLFYSYMNFLGQLRPKAEGLSAKMNEAKEAGNTAQADKAQNDLKQLDVDVKQYQKDLFTNHPKSLTAAIIKASMEVEVPEFKGSKEESDRKRWRYYKAHWFDNFDMSDERMLRSPVLFKRIDHYLTKMTVQHPDSICNSVSTILELLKDNEEGFKYYLVRYLNEYAQSKIVGMDAVYVCIVEKYYATGRAPWTDEEQLKKITENAATLKPILIGKKAPDIQVQLLDIEGTIAAKDVEDDHKKFKTEGPITLHSLPNEWTVLFIWDPDCGHCKKSMPKIIEFYDTYKSKGVEIFALCSRVYKDLPACAEMIKEKGMINWINAVDPYLQSKFKTIYDVRSTPQIFILDDNKEIVSKRIGAEQLPEVLDQLIKIKAEKALKGE